MGGKQRKIPFYCSNCGVRALKNTGHYNHSIKIGRKLYCTKKCAGVARRTDPAISSEQRRKEYMRTYIRAYHKKNEKSLKEKREKYYWENVEILRERKRKYARENKETLRLKNRKKYYDNREEILLKRRERYKNDPEYRKKVARSQLNRIDKIRVYRANNREYINMKLKEWRKKTDYLRKWREKNKERIREQEREYSLKNKDKVKLWKKTYEVKNRKTLNAKRNIRESKKFYGEYFNAHRKFLEFKKALGRTNEQNR